MANPPPTSADPHAPPVPPGCRVAIAWSTYDTPITRSLLSGAQSLWNARGGEDDNLTILEAPGSYELPQVAMVAAESGRFEGIVALGCLIKGETMHDQHIASAVADGLMRVALDTGVPTAFGVLTTLTREQALARSGGDKGNKGGEAMAACIATITTTRTLVTPRAQGRIA